MRGWTAQVKEKYGEAERETGRRETPEETGLNLQDSAIILNLDSIQRTKDVFVIAEYSQPLRNSSPIN